ARQGRIAKTITAASRRRSPALRQGVKAAAQSAVIHYVTAAILVWTRRGRCGTAKKCCAGDRRGAKRQKLFHVLSPGFVKLPRGPRETRPSVPLSSLSKDAKSGSPETTSLRDEAPLFNIEDGRRVVDRPITSDYRNDAMWIDHLDTRDVSICSGRFNGTQ